MTTKIRIKDHLKEYIIGKYPPEGGAVCFPDELDLYHTIYDLLETRPVNAGIDKGNLTIKLPERKNGKNTETYNYLGLRAIKIIQKKIEVKFWAELHDLLDENKHIHGIEYADTVFHFMCKYKIVSISEDAILKNYYRWRNNVRKKEKRAYTRKKYIKK